MDIFCGNYIVDNSSFSGSAKGITAVNAANSIIQNCEFLINIDSGILLYDSTNFTVHQNGMRLNNGSGIYTSYTRYCDISSNNIEENGNGIVLSASDGNTVSDNIIMNNRRGLYLDGRCNSNVIVMNTFADNYLGNAFDNGYDNIWTFNSTLGNTWSDYSGIGKYIIPGLARAIDQAPQATDPLQMARNRSLFAITLLCSPVLLVCLVLASSRAKKHRSKLSSLCVTFPGILDNRSGDSRRVISEVAAIQRSNIHIDLVCSSISDSSITDTRCFIVPPIEKEYSRSLLHEMLRALKLSLRTGIRVFSAVVASDSKGVHVHTGHPVGTIAGLIGGRSVGSKCILDIHDLIPETAVAIRQRHHSRLLYWILMAFERLIVKMSSHLIVTSDGQELVLSRRYPRKGMTIVYNPVHSKELPERIMHEDPSRFVLAYLGELQQGIRGLEQLIDEFSQAAASAKTIVELLLIGSGDAEQELRNLVRQKRCSESIRFVGRMEHTKAIELMASCDLAVIPYPRTLATETVIPTKLLEAMSLGMPILATGSPQFRHVIGPDAFYFDSEQQGSLKKAILEAAGGQQDLSEIGIRMKTRAKRYLWDKSAENLLKLYDELFDISKTDYEQESGGVD